MPLEQDGHCQTSVLYVKKVFERPWLVDGPAGYTGSAGVA